MQLVKLSPPNKGVEINTAQVVACHEVKGGELYMVFMANGHKYTITKAEYTNLKKWLNKE